MNKLSLAILVWGMDWSNKRIIKKHKKSKRFRKLTHLDNFKAHVIIRTKNNKIWR